MRSYYLLHLIPKTISWVYFLGQFPRPRSGNPADRLPPPPLSHPQV